MDRQRKRELRALNERAWSGEKDLYPVKSSLDSTMKKNTAFIRRLRTAISAPNQASLLSEIGSLSLSKYLSEIISASYEGLCRLKSPSEIEAGIEIISALHQRFGPSDFTEYLGWHLGKGMATPDRSYLKTLTPEIREKEEKDRIVRQRILLRVVTELWLVGVLRTLEDVSRPDDATKTATTGKTTEAKPRGASSSSKTGGSEPFPLEVLKDLLGHDREHVNLPLLVSFVKAFNWDILGLKAPTSEGRKTVEEDGATKTSGKSEDDDNSTEDPTFTSSELQEKFKNILKRYFEDVKGHLVRDQKAIFSQSRRNAEAYVKSGEVFEDRQSNYDKQVKAQERFVANAQVIADVIGAEMPDLKDGGENTSATNGSIGIVKTGEYLRGQGEGAGIWEDEDERRFYENLVDLKGKVPGILLEDVKKKKPEDEQVGKKNESGELKEASKAVDTSADDLSTSIANKNIGAQVDALLVRLAELTNKDAIDQMAYDFCFLNSKASRNRLVKALSEIPKGRSDLLPYWGRLVATLGKYMPDIPKALVEHLDNEFRSLQRRKEKEFLGQVRLSNIRYLAELTKFGVVPEHVVFHCLKVSLDDFSKVNIEIICNLLENCGRYLLRNPETSPRMGSFLETLQRKRHAQHLGPTERMLIENAVYYVDPPDRPAIQQKEQTPMELFLRKLVYLDLTKRNYSKILKQLRRVHWEEKEVVATLFDIFSQPGKIKYGNIHLLAILISAIYRYHAAFVVRAIDAVTESIGFDLELNDFKFNQRRIAEVKYIAELYNYRMLEHPVIFDTMYKILTFGHGGPPMPGRINPFDQSDDFFRIRLIATMLETCGMFFNRGPAGKKLDYFLSFFQYYIYTKHTLPMDIEFIVQDTFACVRPQWKLASNIQEASQAFHLAVAQDQKTNGIERATAEAEDPDADGSDGSSSEDEDGDDHVDELPIPADGSDSEAEDLEDADAQQSPTPQESDEEFVVTRQQEEIDLEEEADFEREYAKMMAESLDTRKFDRKPIFDAALPVRSKTRDTAAIEGDGEETKSSPGKVSFALLTKKGNRQATRTLELPSDSDFAVAIQTQQQHERAEQQKIKNLVLNLDLQQNEDPEGHRDDRPTIIHRHNHIERTGKDRQQRARKLQMSDVMDWYDPTTKDAQKSAQNQNPQQDIAQQSAQSPRQRQPPTPSASGQHIHRDTQNENTRPTDPGTDAFVPNPANESESNRRARNRAFRNRRGRFAGRF